MLHSNGQLRTERDGHIQKGCQKHAVQHKITFMMKDMAGSVTLQTFPTSSMYFQSEGQNPAQMLLLRLVTVEHEALHF